MTATAATQDALGVLHSKLTGVFQTILEKYIKKLSEDPTEDFDEEGMLVEIMEFQPDPRILNAIASFLKDNQIRFADETTSKLGDLDRALEERQRIRANVSSLRNLKVVGG